MDFLRATLLFDGRPTVSFEALTGSEVRTVTTGVIAGKFCTVIWTLRLDRRRIISLRRSRDEERRAYRQLHGG
ncbi:MAG: BrnT family toxin [Devosia sp.]|nr:BrnT family toxin [Devosia sp.]